MADLARRFLSTPATEASVERVWSIAGKILTDERRNLTHDMFSDLIFINQNWAHHTARVAATTAPPGASAGPVAAASAPASS